MEMNWPREVCSAVSVAQTGTIAFRMPVPHPLMRRAVAYQHFIQPILLDIHTAYHPVVVLSRALKGCSNNSPSGAKANGLDTSISITEGTANEAADESAEIVDRDDAPLKEGVCDNWSSGLLVQGTQPHGILIVVDGVVDTPHHSLIITEEEDGKTGDAVDGDE